MRSHYLKTLFSPKSIALFGASNEQDTVGQVVFKNILAGGFKGPVYAINPNHEEIQGEKAYRDLASIGKPVDLAVVATPAKTLLAIVEEARQSGCHRIVLDSHISMKKAHAIYHEVGFRIVSTPDDFPENLKPIVVFMDCDITANH